MRRKFIILSIVMLLVITASILFLLFAKNNQVVEVNNTAPAKEVVTKDYDLEKLLLAEAIFNVRSGFEDVNAFDLAKEVEVKLECKRQVSETQFYYVLVGNGYKCFMITDKKDVVREVLVVKDFATIAQTREYIEEYGSEVSVLDTTAFRFCETWRYCGHSSVHMNYLFTLQDGVMIMQTKGKEEYAKYIYFTDNEWREVYEQWEGFVILPIDKN